MIVMSQKRMHSRWRMFFILCILLGLIENCELISTGRLSDSGPSPLSSSPSLSESNSGRRRSQEIGSPIEWAWKAWLLLDAQTVADLSGTDPDTNFAGLRTKFAKSIFDYQQLLSCPPGYHMDKTDTCIKDHVNIDPNGQLKFLVKILNIKHRNQSANTKSGGTSSNSNNDQEKSRGPLKVTLPLISNDSQPAILLLDKAEYSRPEIVTETPTQPTTETPTSTEASTEPTTEASTEPTTEASTEAQTETTTMREEESTTIPPV